MLTHVRLQLLGSGCVMRGVPCAAAGPTAQVVRAARERPDLALPFQDLDSSDKVWDAAWGERSVSLFWHCPTMRDHDQEPLACRSRLCHMGCNKRTVVEVLCQITTGVHACAGLCTHDRPIPE